MESISFVNSLNIDIDIDIDINTEEKEIKMKNICPVIGMISSGKSSILNALLNMNLLETSPEVTTKFVTIIRYNKDVKDNPKFYKLFLEKKENNVYKFYKKDGTEIIGKENIKQKIRDLNKELNQEDPQYEDIFYMLEIGQVNFIDEEFLKYYDLADIPGVSENVQQYASEEIKFDNSGNFGNSEDAPTALIANKSNLNYTPSTEEELTNYNFENEINYLTQIFKIIKNQMKTGIFIFSIDKYQLAENYKIIGKLKLILDRPIENFLILLNKMDTSDNIEEDIKSLKGRFLQEFPNGGFNITRNTIIQCSSFQLENELNMDKNFSNFLYYHYINFIMNKKECKDFIESLKDFTNYFLKKDIESIDRKTFENNIKSIRNDKELDNIKILIETINKNHDVLKYKLLISESDFDKSYITNCLDEIEEDDCGNINLVDQKNNTILILYYYYLFKNKKIKLFKSKNIQEIINYFTIKNMNRDFGYEEVQKYLKELEIKETYDKKIDNILKLVNEFDEKYEKEGINLDLREGFKRSMKSMIDVFKTSKMFFVPLIGVYNSGKSTILNNIIGYDLLPTNNGECTKKGILIKHWDYDIPIIRKAKFIVENTGSDNDICYFHIKDEIIAHGDENVKNILKGLNCHFIEKEEDFFYIINVKIKFLDIFTNDNDIKQNICFIDLPGYGTKNKSEAKNIYSKFIKSCKLFLMISRDHFEDISNIEKINNIIKITSKYQGISIQSLIKKFLFIINPSKDLDLSENSLLKKKKSLINNIRGLNANANKDLNATFFNALSYQYYLSNKKYFDSFDYLFKKEQNHYEKEKEDFQKGLKLSGPGKFEKYLLKSLKDNLKTTFDKVINKIASTELEKEIDESVNKFFEAKDYSMNKQDLQNIKLILSYANQNIDKCKYFNESNYLNFKFYLFARIMTSKIDADVEFKKVIENNLDNLKKIFYSNYNLKPGDLPIYKEIKNDAEEVLKIFKKEISEKIKDIKVEKCEKDVPKIFEKSIETIMQRLKDSKDKIETDLKKQKKDQILYNFENLFQNEVSIQKEKIIKTLEDFSDNLKNHYNETLKTINMCKNNPRDNYEFDELKVYISNHLGEGNDYKEAISNIINDILSASKNATNWENSTGLFDYLKSIFSDEAYLKKTTNYIIDNTLERLSDFRKIISNLIDEYLETIFTKIDVEKNSLIVNLEEQKRIKDLEIELNKQFNENEKKGYEKRLKDEEEKRKKWNILCQEYNKLEVSIKNFMNNDNKVIEYNIGNSKNFSNSEDLPQTFI